jgi:hypothetical protein
MKVFVQPLAELLDQLLLHCKMKNQHLSNSYHNTMIPMSTTARAMLDPEADKVDEQTDTAGLY